MRIDVGLTRDEQERIALSYDDDGRCDGVVLTPTDPRVIVARQRAALAALVGRFGPVVGCLLYRVLTQNELVVYGRDGTAMALNVHAPAGRSPL